MSWRDWPIYSRACRSDMFGLLEAGGRLTAYQANPSAGVGPREGSWAWRAERLAEEIHHVPHVVMCQSGTQALTILLRALQHDEVYTTAFTFSATVAAIIAAGTKPMFMDVRLDGTINAESANRAVVGVDLFGRQAQDVDVADSCQAVGEPPVARHGVWSFNGRKNVPAGEGGAIYTQSDVVAHTCRLLLNHAENFGSSDIFAYSAIGENGHMNEQTALLVWHGLREVVGRNRHRQNMARVLGEALHPVRDRVVMPANLDNHTLYVYPLIVERGCHEIGARLKAAGVECQPGYITPTLEEYPAFRHLPHGDLTNTHALSRERLIVFPQVTPTATEAEMEELGAAIVKAMA